MGKRIENAYKTVNKEQAYALKDAVKIVKQNATAKFDETIDIAVNLGVDPKYAVQVKLFALLFWRKVKKLTKLKLPVQISSELKA